MITISIISTILISQLVAIIQLYILYSHAVIHTNNYTYYSCRYNRNVLLIEYVF